MSSTVSCKTRKYPKIMAMQDGAAYLRASRSSLNRWALERRNPAIIRRGGRYCVDATALAEQVYPYPGEYQDAEDGYIVLPLLYTVSEAAETLGVVDVIVYRAIRDGHVYAVQIGKRYLIPDHQMDNLRDYVECMQLVKSGG